MDFIHLAFHPQEPSTKKKKTLNNDLRIFFMDKLTIQTLTPFNKI